jgi:hypothetical protein
MPDTPAPDRFKPDMPQIPGVAKPGAGRSSGSNPAIRLVAGLLAVLVLVFLVARWVLRPKHAEPPAVEAPAQMEVPAPPPDPASLLPHATEAEPGIATLAELGKPWSSKDFFIRNRLTAEYIPAVIVRLPGGSPTQAASYWAFSLRAPYGNCQLEYVADMDKLKNDYGYRGAKHPMVGNPCSRTLFDPLRLTNLPGNVWVRGAIVQGSDLRPPLGVELQIQGKNILAMRSE